MSDDSRGNSRPHVLRPLADFGTRAATTTLRPLTGAVEAAAGAGLNLERADYVISGIPYTTIPAPVRRQILADTHKLLHPEGGFLVYQFTRTVLPYLEPVFGKIQQDFEPRNILPARLFHCTP